MSTMKHILILSACFTSLNTMYDERETLHNGLTARKVNSKEENHQYSRSTKPKLNKREKDTTNIDREKEKVKTNRAITRARNIKLRNNTLPSDEESVIFTRLGIFYGSTPEEAQERYNNYKLEKEREADEKKQEADEREGVYQWVDKIEKARKQEEQEAKEDARWFEEQRRLEIAYLDELELEYQKIEDKHQAEYLAKLKSAKKDEDSFTPSSKNTYGSKIKIVKSFKG